MCAGAHIPKKHSVEGFGNQARVAIYFRGAYSSHDMSGLQILLPQWANGKVMLISLLDMAVCYVMLAP